MKDDKNFIESIFTKEYPGLMEEMFDIIRGVDPVRNKVVFLKNHLLCNIMPCFDFWKQNKICDNCISLKAFHGNKTFVKLEYLNEKDFLIMAVPVIFNRQRLVIEFLKDITNSLSVVIGENQIDPEVKQFIDNFNYKMAYKDELTNLYNRRFINEKLPLEIKRHLYENSPLSIIFLDLDEFKRINDSFDHQAGDFILKATAEIVVENIRNEKDWVARYGGDEFLICLPDTDSNIARNIAERLRSGIENQIFHFHDLKFRLTASLGVYTNYDQELQLDTLIKMADKELYRAKVSGKNKVCLYNHRNA